jgi:hypothetical protein
MAEEQESKGGLQLNFGHLHITATIALLSTVVGGFYTGVTWLEHARETMEQDTKIIEEVQQKLRGLDAVIQAQNERDNTNDDNIHQQIFQIEQQLTEMSSHMQQIYQPDVPLRRTRR